MLVRPPKPVVRPPKPATIRTRRYRRRLRDGVCIVRVPIPGVEVAEVAISLALLTPQEALDRAKLAEVVEGLVTSWLAHWRSP